MSMHRPELSKDSAGFREGQELSSALDGTGDSSALQHVPFKHPHGLDSEPGLRISSVLAG